ncbi:MAG TPA: WecB/TagA/CpsF family glycosyltransferase [Pirellulales bacterium]|nr:WecB/TagA/CpsF family glycosyltransferase [Pirellulales bacterium]
MVAAPETISEGVVDVQNHSCSQRVRILGLDIAPLTVAETLDQVDQLVRRREPSYLITANLNYAMLSARDARLAAVNRNAAVILADGMPLVWAAKMAGKPLPGRTTGADLVPALAARAAERGYRTFLLGSSEEAAHAAAESMCSEHPKLKIVGIESPMVNRLSSAQTAALVGRIRQRKPDILLAALGQPKGELWIAEHYQSIAAPVSIQIGASLEFVSGYIQRAPGWMQRSGLEWLFRLGVEPRRLSGRYAQNGLFLLDRSARGAWGSFRRSVPAVVGRR